MTRRKAVLILIAAALILSAAVWLRGMACEEDSEYTPRVCTVPPTEHPVIENTPEPEPEPEPAAAWSEADATALAQTAWGEGGGCRTTEIAAIMWSVLNRVDAWGGTPYSQCAASGQFYGYSPRNPVDERMYELAVDVLCRWAAERSGRSDVGRVLPADYLWFSGDGTHNYFRNAYRSAYYWDWSLPSPYAE